VGVAFNVGAHQLVVHAKATSSSAPSEQADLNVMEVAAITGHKTLDMLKRYTHLRAEDLAKKLR
jgi:hypothetical protein